MLGLAKREARALWRGIAALDRQTLTVLLLASILGMWKYTFGGTTYFAEEIAPVYGLDPQSLWPYLYQFGTQGLTGFVLPVLLLLLVFRRKPAEIGLGLGDWKLATGMLVLYLPIVTVGCWLLSAQPSFQQKYVLYDAAEADWTLFLAYEVLFLFYWLGWEYLWRGFVLFGTKHTFGAWAILIQMMPFAALHATKPTAEAYLSILGGAALGIVVYRCRSYWIAIPFHSFQMFAMDLFCSLRGRTGVQGTGLADLWQVLRDGF